MVLWVAVVVRGYVCGMCVWMGWVCEEARWEGWGSGAWQGNRPMPLLLFFFHLPLPYFPLPYPPNLHLWRQRPAFSAVPWWGKPAQPSLTRRVVNVLVAFLLGPTKPCPMPRAASRDLLAPSPTHPPPTTSSSSRRRTMSMRERGLSLSSLKGMRKGRKAKTEEADSDSSDEEYGDDECTSCTLDSSTMAQQHQQGSFDSTSSSSSSLGAATASNRAYKRQVEKALFEGLAEREIKGNESPTERHAWARAFHLLSQGEDKAVAAVQEGRAVHANVTETAAKVVEKVEEAEESTIKKVVAR